MSHCPVIEDMAIYIGRYSWDGTKKGDREPIAWSGGAYDVKIYRRKGSASKVELLKTHVCIYAKTGIGQSISETPEKFAQHICHDFSLNIERVVWVEDHLKGKDRYEIIRFTRLRKIGKTIIYETEKRSATPREVEQLERELQSLKQ